MTDSFFEGLKPLSLALAADDLFSSCFEVFAHPTHAPFLSLISENDYDFDLPIPPYESLNSTPMPSPHPYLEDSDWFPLVETTSHASPVSSCSFTFADVSLAGLAYAHHAVLPIDSPSFEDPDTDDEIDVVTVGDTPTPPRLLPGQSSPTCATKRTAGSEGTPSPKRSAACALLHPAHNNSSFPTFPLLWGSFGDMEEAGEGERRNMHNVLERQRRNDLKASFDSLRDAVPGLASSERAPKVRVLKHAIEYLARLKLQLTDAHEARHSLLAEQAQLQQRLCILLT